MVWIEVWAPPVEVAELHPPNWAPVMLLVSTVSFWETTGTPLIRMATMLRPIIAATFIQTPETAPPVGASTFVPLAESRRWPSWVQRNLMVLLPLKLAITKSAWTRSDEHTSELQS